MKIEFTLGDIKRFIKENENLSDDTTVVVQRIEDKYFRNGGWRTYLVEGESYHNALRFNNEMREEMERIKLNQEREYPDIKNHSEYLIEIADNLKDQFYYPNCITKDKNNTILIYGHY